MDDETNAQLRDRLAVLWAGRYLHLDGADIGAIGGYEVIARNSYAFADAMLAARNKEVTGDEDHDG